MPEAGRSRRHRHDAEARNIGSAAAARRQEETPDRQGEPERQEREEIAKQKLLGEMGPVEGQEGLDTARSEAQ